VAEIMRYLHQRYRYLGDWRASNRGYVPFDLAQIEQNGYGDCKDLSILLAAMLREAGVTARPALVERGLYALPMAIPGVTANHAIVQVNIAGKIEWLDPTQYYYVPGYVAPDIQDRAALVFTPEGKVIVDAIPAFTPPEEERIERNETFTAQERSTVHERQVRMKGSDLANLFQGDRIVNRVWKVWISTYAMRWQMKTPAAGWNTTRHTISYLTPTRSISMPKIAML
ncbi:transglutaminase family protein, partial [Sodalis-like symbiont of Bactericera trigonica]